MEDNIIIPIIEAVPEKNGFWEIYPDHQIWHDESDLDIKMGFKDYKETAKKYGVGSGDWMNLQEGQNKVRIISAFEDYGTHFNPTIKKSTICIGKEECKLCQEGLKPRVQFLGWVIDRKDNQVKLLRIGFQAYQQIGKLAESDDYGFEETPEYDITITRTGQGLETDYTVLAARKNTELTPEERTQIAEKTKDPKEIIENMKAKIKTAQPQGDINEEGEEEVEGGEKNEVDVKDIPF